MSLTSSLISRPSHPSPLHPNPLLPPHTCCKNPNVKKCSLSITSAGHLNMDSDKVFLHLPPPLQYHGTPPQYHGTHLPSNYCASFRKCGNRKRNTLKNLRNFYQSTECDQQRCFHFGMLQVMR
jgi:hypothetical protein